MLSLEPSYLGFVYLDESDIDEDEFQVLSMSRIPIK